MSGGDAGAAVAPPPQQVSVCTLRGEAVHWTATSPDVPWVTIQPASGATSQFTCSPVNVRVDPATLGGEHTGTLRFTSPEAFNDPIDLAVTLDIVE